MGRSTRAIVIAVEVVLVLVIATRWSGAESGAGERDAIASRSVASSGEESGPAPSSATPTSAPAPGATAPTTTVPATAGTSATAPEGARILLAGDSIMRQTGPALNALFDESVAIDNEAVNGSGLLTPGHVDWVARLQGLVAANDPDAVVFLFIGNYTDTDFWLTEDGQPVLQDTLAFYAAWSRQADHLMEALDASDAEVYWVLPPPEYTEQNRAITANLRQLYTQMADRWPRVHLVDANVALAGPNGEYLDAVTDESGAVVHLRATDTVHLTEAGAARLAATIHEAVAANL